jgi:FolB domain-containing protein
MTVSVKTPVKAGVLTFLGLRLTLLEPRIVASPPRAVQAFPSVNVIGRRSAKDYDVGETYSVISAATLAMHDQIRIHDLLIRGILGINDDERTQPQDIVVSLVLTVDTRQAAKSDDIADAVNYRTLTKDVIEHVEKSSCLLVERLVDEVARLVLRDPRVEAVEVSIDKPGALRFAKSVGVTIFRTREDV